MTKKIFWYAAAAILGTASAGAEGVGVMSPDRIDCAKESTRVEPASATALQTAPNPVPSETPGQTTVEGN